MTVGDRFWAIARALPISNSQTQMILSEIQNFIKQQGKTSIAELEMKFKIDSSALRGMLDKLIRKGRIKKMGEGQKCGGCKSCAPDAIEFYEWVGNSKIGSSPF